MDLVTLGIVLFGIVVAIKVLWELHLSPLARQRIPGPRLAALSEIWNYWVQFRGDRNLTFHDCFEQYGPVVRVGPNRVAFRNIETVKSIYSTHRFRKSSWWNGLTFGGEQNMVSTSDPAYHAHLRRLSAPAFRGENLRAAGHVFIHEMDVLVDRLRRDCADGGYIDVLKMFPMLTLDLLGLAVLGVHFDQIASMQEPLFAENLNSWKIDKVLIQPLPSVVRKLPIPRLQKILAGDSSITSYVENLYAQVDVDEKSSEERPSMLATYKAYRDSETGEPAPLPLIVGELSMMFVAGMETTATSMVYLAYYLALHEEMRIIMRSEVGVANLQAADFVDMLRGLPYLNAFVREVLRVHAPLLNFLERVVPSGGATLDGYFLPAGTLVGGQAYSSHFDARVFPQPHRVDPLRWVRLDNATGKYVNREDLALEMSSHYFPFSFGARSCVGKALADLELTLVTATLVQNFRIYLHETVTAESMSPVGLGATRPRGGRCLLHFEYSPVSAT